MYQSIIRDPGGNGLIRIQPDVCGQYSAIVNGSILVVPPGTTAFVAINGTLSRPYGPGRYEIFTGVDPFFVRLRNILTRGDTGTTVSVFFVSTERTKFVKAALPSAQKICHAFFDKLSYCIFELFCG